METKIIEIIKQIILDKEDNSNYEINENTKLKDDLNFNSIDLATLTVMDEDMFSIDIFENGNVISINDIYVKLRNYVLD